MRNKISNPANQLRQVVLLLVIAVILPAVCLLWFMTQAVKNERLAIRQKMIDTYTSRAQDVFYKDPFSYRNLADKNLTTILQNLPADSVRQIENLINKQSYFSSLVIFDQDRIIYPVRASQKTTGSSDAVQKVWKLEFADANYSAAIKEYNAIAKLSADPTEVYECRMGIVRCLSKQNKTGDAITICYELAYPDKHIINEYRPQQIAYARLMLADLYCKANHKDLFKELKSQFSDVGSPAIPAETKIFILGELIKLAQKAHQADRLSIEIETAQKIIDTGGQAIAAADYISSKKILYSQPEQVFFKIHIPQPLYGIYFKIADKQIAGLVTNEKMTQFWQKNADDFTDELVFCKIYDDKGQQIAGLPKKETAQGEMFSTLNLKNYFTGFKAELYFRFGGFKGAANKRMFAYLWIALIVIAFMLTTTFLAGRAVLKQARLSRLKNDFLATVTHELKTPLSSMRVLVDTLLEGRCENQQHQIEYLQLISKENIRLSKLIDNFLTFSRMERNKQVFDMASVSPVEIANTAAEAIQAKFEKANVHFSMNVLKPLPMIEADKDAMVTVLLNLLDNACKYSLDRKQIELDVFAEETKVCFSVKDNGIGMTRRQMKKIFDRFYQADTSLARRTEGAGLGLSIVKFIVDAHKGKIDVESKPDRGSKFTVMLGFRV